MSATLNNKYAHILCVLRSISLACLAASVVACDFSSQSPVQIEFTEPPQISGPPNPNVPLVATVAIGKHAVRDVDLDTNTNVAAENPTAVPDDSLGLGKRIVKSLQGNSMFNLLTNFVIFAASIFYLLAVLAVIVLRIRRPEAERPYKTLGYPFVPLAFIAAYVWFLSQVYSSNPLESIMGLALIAIGIPAYFVFARNRKQDVNEEQTQ